MKKKFFAFGYFRNALTKFPRFMEPRLCICTPTWEYVATDPNKQFQRGCVVIRGKLKPY